MNTTKKILSLVLALAMTASMGVSTLFAATTGTDSGEPFEIEFGNDDVTLPAGSDKISNSLLVKGELDDGSAPRGDIAVIYNGLVLELNELREQLATGKVGGVALDSSVIFSWSAISLSHNGSLIRGAELSKPLAFIITIPKANLPTEFKVDPGKIKVARSHYILSTDSAQVTLLDANSKYAANGDLVIRFESDKFSVFQPVLTEVKEEKIASDDRPEKKKLAEEWTHVPAGVVTDAERGETIRIKLTSGSLIPYNFIELAKDLDLKIEATYFDVTYKGEGKTFSTPPEGRVFYDTDEFIKMLKVSK